MKYLLFGFAVLGCALVVYSTCDTQAISKDHNNVHWEKDALNCSKYYICFRGVSHHLTCPTDMYYFPGARRCSDDENVCDAELPPGLAKFRAMEGTSGKSIAIHLTLFESLLS